MRLALVALLALALLAGCLKATPGACATPPKGPLMMDVQLENACALRDGGASLVLVAHANSAIPQFSWGAFLAPSLGVAPGAPEETRDLAAGENATMVMPLRPAREGPHDVRAWADSPALRGLGFSMARGYDLQIVEPPGEEPRLEPREAQRIEFDVRIDAEEGNATRLVATFVSPIRVDAVALLYFSWSPATANVTQSDTGWYYGIEDHPEWEGERAPGGRWGTYLAWNGTLDPGLPLVLRYHAPMPPSDGEWTISAHLIPDARIDAGVHSDEAGFLVEDERASLVRNRQPR